MSQLTLETAARQAKQLETLGITRRIRRQPKPSIQERFERFRAENPHVYELLVSLSREVKRSGLPKYSMKAIFEQARWHMNIQKKDRDFKLNNDYHSRYARLIMEQEPDLKGFFETRKRVKIERRTSDGGRVDVAHGGVVV